MKDLSNLELLSFSSTTQVTMRLGHDREELSPAHRSLFKDTYSHVKGDI
jgi:hypothetical protein